jgi:hypothetical protein
MDSFLTEQRPRVLVLMACGVVDLLTAFTWNCWDRAEALKLPKLIADAQLEMLEELYTKTGARDFVWVNLFPTYRAMRENPAAQKAMRGFVEGTNGLVDEYAALFRSKHPDASLEIVDWHAAMSFLYDTPTSDLAKRYFGPEGVDMFSSCLQFRDDGSAVFCEDSDRRFFWDGHFSRAGHRYLADFTQASVERMEDKRRVEMESERPVATNAPLVSGAGKKKNGWWMMGTLAVLGGFGGL